MKVLKSKYSNRAVKFVNHTKIFLHKLFSTNFNSNGQACIYSAWFFGKILATIALFICLTWHQVMHIGPLSMQGRSVLDAVEMAYAREVYLHNEAVIQGKQHSLVEAFCNVSKKFQDKVICCRET